MLFSRLHSQIKLKNLNHLLLHAPLCVSSIQGLFGPSPHSDDDGEGKDPTTRYGCGGVQLEMYGGTRVVLAHMRGQGLIAALGAGYYLGFSDLLFYILGCVVLWARDKCLSNLG
ncbi:uncharacterized protein [Gossypium hirsutum]|uniref:Uncharacterized protein n=1 Tax=Gossypium hirsutum TaxID=3635 RepID=A0ABM3B2Y1_GOSHI|nr:uncharacterized protein LOC121223611 [Gossypium hirsutum]